MIKFGTDGWRAKIADEFTFSNVRLVTAAAANFLSDKLGKHFLVGYDNRFQSEHFAKEAAQVMSACGFDTYLSKRSLPTPFLSFAVKKMGAAGGIMITASHNPPEWNGLKIKADFGGSASPEMTKGVENELNKILASGNKDIGRNGPSANIKSFDPFDDYVKHVEGLVNFELIASKNIKIVIDPMHGSGAGYLKMILEKHGIESVEVNANRDPLFGGLNPEPLPPELEELISETRETSLRNKDSITVGLALDGDADRIAAVDQTGAYISSHNILCILFRHLVEGKKMTGEVVKTFNITALLTSLAKQYGLTVHETPIGFKYICDLMLKRDILIGGEESGGIGVKGHIPERDATLNSLLLLEAVAREGRPLKGILDNIMEKHGRYFYNRIDLHLTEEAKARTLEKLKGNPPSSFAGYKVVDIKALDGTKLFFEDSSWILFRASGTEPLLRIYAEGRSIEQVKKLLAQGEDLTK